MKNAAVFGLILIILAVFAGCGNKTPEPVLEAVTQEKEDTFSCMFDGVKHRFVLELPDVTENAPLVLMLPGYGNNAEAFRLQTSFDKDACPLGYAVVYVTGARDPNFPGSSLGWNYEGNPEGNSDVEFLTALARYLQEEYSLDKTRQYAVGFSNGAFMIHRLAMEAQDTFSAFVSVAGFMPESVWKERRESNSAGFFQITGEKDNAVPKKSDGSADFSRAPAIEDVMEYWAGSNGLQQSETSEIGNGSLLTKYRNEGKTQQVWSLTVSDGRHSWPDSFNNIDTNALILEFLETQQR